MLLVNNWLDLGYKSTLAMPSRTFMYLISEGMLQTNSISTLLLFLLITGSIAQNAKINDGVNLTYVVEGADSTGNRRTNVQQRFITVHEVTTGTSIRTYIWPKELCQVVVFCEYTGNGTEIKSDGAKYPLKGDELCQGEKLVYFAYESAIQKIPDDGKAPEKKKYLPSPALEFKWKGGNLEIMASDDYDNVGSTSEPKDTVSIKITNKLATLTNSPYCQILFDQDGKGVANFHTIETDDLVKTHTHLNGKVEEYSYFTLSNSKTEKIILDNLPSYSSMEKVNTNSSKHSECEDFWNLPQYGRKSEANKEILMQEYDYAYGDTGNIASFVLDTQDHSEMDQGKCSWVKVCIGNGASCSKPSEFVELLFQYGMFMPTDSDSAHAFGAPRQHLRRIRFEIKKNKEDKYVMFMSYALSGQEQKGLISHVMRLSDTFKLPTAGGKERSQITLLQSDNCAARLLNDWNSLQTSSRKTAQLITIKKCNVVATKELTPEQ